MDGIRHLERERGGRDGFRQIPPNCSSKKTSAETNDANASATATAAAMEDALRFTIAQRDCDELFSASLRRVPHSLKYEETATQKFIWIFCCPFDDFVAFTERKIGIQSPPPHLSDPIRSLPARPVIEVRLREVRRSGVTDLGGTQVTNHTRAEGGATNGRWTRVHIDVFGLVKLFVVVLPFSTFRKIKLSYFFNLFFCCEILKANI